MNPEQKHVYDLKQSGMTLREIADTIGISLECTKSRWKRAKKWIDAPSALRGGAAAIGADTVANVVWTKTHPNGTTTYSVQHVRDKGKETREEILSKIADAFADVNPYTPRHPRPVNSEFCTVYPLYDMHSGMFAWGRETRGQDYDLKLMKSDLVQSIDRVSSMSPASDHAVVIFGGDAIHVNDAKSETPGSGHKMDADGRYEKIVDMTIEAITNAIELLAERHAKVSVYVIRGNHDEDSHVVLKAALRQRYRNDDAIEFPTLDQWDKSEIYWVRHGASLIIMHHGDKCKPERLAMIAADKCPYWSETRHRVILTGHLHHLKVQDFPGVTHYTLRAFCPPDAYGAMFGGVRGLQAMTFCKRKGLVMQAHDPIDRELIK